MGAGPVGCELAQCFGRLGARVTLIEQQGQILCEEDEDVSSAVEEVLREEGVEVRTGHEVVRVEVVGEEKGLVARRGGETVCVPFDALLVAVGRTARVEGFGLEDVGVTLRNGRIETDEYLRTRVPTIYACGDCVGPYLYTHAASHQAWHAAVNALFSNPFRRFKVDYSVLPRVTFTYPEVARVGLNETEARARDVAHAVTRYDLAELDRAITDESNRGMVKVLTAQRSDRILGATVVGERAGETIAEFTLAMRHGIGLKKLLATIHPYPTLSEATKLAAGEWRRANAPARVLALLERYHAWRAGR
jgi:pyruvate/2-oxoglutarate dehydrogenase complex dihydrolipoamide dehydrogenase (E3) component